jgi:hypothetical protein
MADILELLHVARNSGAHAQLAIFTSLELAAAEESVRVKAFNSVLGSLGSQAGQELGLRKLLLCLQQVSSRMFFVTFKQAVNSYGNHYLHPPPPSPHDALFSRQYPCMIQCCCGSGMIILDPRSEFFHPGSRVKRFRISDPQRRIYVFLTQKIVSHLSKYDQG